MNANTIIASALRKLLVVPAGGTPTATQYAVGLELLNDIIVLWSADNRLIYEESLEEISINSGTQSFTLGSTGDYVTAKPVDVIAASIRDSGKEYPLDIIDRNIYERFSDKTLTHRPQYLYFRNTEPDSTLYFDTTTGAAYTLILTSNKALTTFPDGTTDINLPPHYEGALKAALTVEIAPEMGAANRVTPLMKLSYDNAKDAIIGRSVRLGVSSIEIPSGHHYERNGDYG